jgi:hypothetical protein
MINRQDDEMQSDAFGRELDFGPLALIILDEPGRDIASQLFRRRLEEIPVGLDAARKEGVTADSREFHGQMGRPHRGSGHHELGSLSCTP